MNLHLNLLVSVIIQKYFLNSRCIIYFSEKFNSLDYTGPIPILQINVQNMNIHKDLIFRYFGCQGIIISNNLPIWTFEIFEKLIRLSSERFNTRRYLILSGNNPKENLTDIFNIKELTHISNMVIIEEYKRKRKKTTGKQYIMDQKHITYIVSTHGYVGLKNNNRRIILDFWSSNLKKFKFNNNLFPNKLLNQMGRELRMATFHYEPYSIIGSTEDTHKGSEMSVALTFARQYNMTPVPVINKEDYWGEIFTNWSGNGLLGNLVLDKADIGFGALYTWEVDYHYLDLSKPLVRTGITCLVPAPKYVSQNMQEVTKFYDNETKKKIHDG
ncbi:uncharacterized protein LOC108915443 [Anoplophora glabripennis]|uniref:uncharacterized protein LOC108915443 n=1 Tax=Anoplophora glabripennis TaxID=217634 RepID=UPI000873A6D1|nr:uncharacterized protein LOC108915443 [Anoplophora glabripennis]